MGQGSTGRGGILLRSSFILLAANENQKCVAVINLRRPYEAGPSFVCFRRTFRSNVVSFPALMNSAEDVCNVMVRFSFLHLSIEHGLMKQSLTVWWLILGSAHVLGVRVFHDHYTVYCDSVSYLPNSEFRNRAYRIG